LHASQLASSGDSHPDDWVIIAHSDWTQSYIDEDIGLTRFNKILLQDDDTGTMFKKKPSWHSSYSMVVVNKHALNNSSKIRKGIFMLPSLNHNT
jgi:hypothetical protein